MATDWRRYAASLLLPFALLWAPPSAIGRQANMPGTGAALAGATGSPRPDHRMGPDLAALLQPPPHHADSPPDTTTIITHGFLTLTGDPPVWAETMGKQILARQVALGGSGGVYIYQPATGRWQRIWGTDDPGSLVLVFNWAAESDGGLAQPGDKHYAVAAADALYAALRRSVGALQGIDPINNRTLHLIGHSRGAVVNSELARRLIRAGVPVAHVTTLDPHPVNPQAFLGPDWGDPIPSTWQGVAWADNYWRKDPIPSPLDFDGMPLSAAANRQLDESALGSFPQQSGYAAEHSDVHLWYHGTIDTTASAHDGTYPITSWMRQHWWPPFSSCPGPSQSYNDTGYAFFLSALAGTALCPPSGQKPQPTDPPVLFGGDFTDTSAAGWAYHGGGGTGDIRTLSGESVLILGQNLPAAEYRTHNRFFLPGDATGLLYDYNITNPGTEETLLLELLDPESDAIAYVIKQVSLNTATGGWLRDQPAVFPSWVPTGGTYRLRLRVTWGGLLNATVRLDNLRIVRAPGPTSINVAISQLAPNPALPGQAVQIAGSAQFNTGAAVVGTALISAGSAQWTTPVANGQWSRLITAPATSGNVIVEVTAQSLQGNAQQYLSVSGTGGGSGYTFNESLTCANVQAVNPWNASDIRPAFACTDPRLYVWTELLNVTQPNVQVKWRWYRPDGLLWFDTTQFQPPCNCGTSIPIPWCRCHWWEAPPLPPLGTMEGTWRVETWARTGTAAWVLRESTPFTMQYHLAEHLMCHDMQPPPVGLPIGPTNTFYQDDARVTAWSELRDVRPALDVRWRYYEPSGSLYDEFTYDVPPPQSQGYSWWTYYRLGGYIGITGYPAASKCGRWRVDVDIRSCAGAWEQIYSDHFDLIERPPVPPLPGCQLVGSTPTAGVPISIAASAIDNTYLHEVTLVYNDGTWHEQSLASSIMAPQFAQQVQLGPYSAGQQVQAYVRARDTSGNMGTSTTVLFTVQDPCQPPVITLQPQSQAQCVGQPVTFCVQASGTVTGYQWHKSGSAIPGATGACYSIWTVSPSDAGGYRCDVSSGCGVVQSATATLTVNSAPVITQQPGVLGPLCWNGTIPLSLCVEAQHAESYQWFKDGAMLAGATAPCYQKQNPGTADAGLYWCRVYGCGHTDSAQVEVEVYAGLSITQQPSSLVRCVGEAAQFCVEYSGGSMNVTRDWVHNGFKVGGGPCYTIASVEPEDAGEIYCVISDWHCGMVYVETVHVTLTVNACSRVYVRSDAAPGGSGLSWATAFSDLQDALEAARANPAIDQVWVAGWAPPVPGAAVPMNRRYRPDSGTLERMRSFELVSGVAIYGGFKGTEITLEERNWRLNLTVLEGDLLGNDIGNPLALREDNTNNIVRVGTAEDAVLDGFWIRSAWSSAAPHVGGGFLNDQGRAVTIANCTFERNDSSAGAALWSTGSPSIVNCTFLDNRVLTPGGAVCLSGTGAPVLTQCLFNGNYSHQDGGGLAVLGGSPVVTNCTFFGNWTRTGRGGGIYAEGAADLRLYNTVLWGNGSDVHGIGEAGQLDGVPPSVIDYCRIKGWTGSLSGVGTNGGNPRFVNPSGPAVFCEAGTCWGTIGADLHLAESSACIDAGRNSSVPASLTHDLLDGDPRFLEDPGTPNAGIGTAPIVDIGVDEFDGTSCYPDCNGDGMPSVADFGCYQTLFVQGDLYADCNRDGVLTVSDFGCFQTMFVQGCP